MSGYRIESLLSARQFVHPQVVGDRVYFISDLSGRLSLYAMNVGGSVPEPLLPPQIALPNPHHLDNAVVFKVLPKLGKILLMLDRDGDENYQPVFVPIEGGVPEPIFGERYAGQQVLCAVCSADTNLAFFTVRPAHEPGVSHMAGEFGDPRDRRAGRKCLRKLPDGLHSRYEYCGTSG